MPASPAVPSPKPVRHVRTLWWWAALVAIAFLVQMDWEPPAAPLEPSQVARTERDAFIAFVFGKVSAHDSEAIQPTVLRAQLEKLKESGAQPVRLQDVEAFLDGRAALPDNPVVLVFDEARRETVEAVDPILAELGLPAAAFVTVGGVESGNVDLVSRRHLRLMAESGRWEFGVNACPAGENGNAVQLGRLHVKALYSWSERPVLAASCLRPWPGGDATRQWTEALEQASLPLGFVGTVSGANRREDSSAMLRLVRVTRENTPSDTLVRHLAAYTPRHERYVDDFDASRLAAAWVGNWHRARVDDGKLHLTAAAGDNGGLLTLGGTDRWHDVRIEVKLARRPAGQFWIYARRSESGAFLRLGVVGGEVALQKSDASGQTRQLGSTPVDGRSLHLTLRVVGLRAMAFADGRPLLDRPAVLPDELVAGPVSLAVWDPESEAHAVIQHVEAEPLARRFALVEADPGDDTFERLRRESDGLWAVSPWMFRWQGGKARALASPSTALEIFAGHHHLALLPAVDVRDLPRGPEWGEFNRQVLQWVEDPRFRGLNLFVDQVPPSEADEVEALIAAVAELGKELTVTERNGSEQPARPGVWYASSQSRHAAFQVVQARLSQ